MKITMLGTSGSGKTVYMSAMAEMFLNGSVDGYILEDRGGDFKSGTFVARTLQKIGSIYRSGVFPAGTSTSTVLLLKLMYNSQYVMDIDWIDYRGEALEELVLGKENEQTAEIKATLLASDVIMVFVDAAVLKVCDNDFVTRSKVGANTISRLLSMVTQKKHVDIIFILSKMDSDLINIKNDFKPLKERVRKIYAHFFASSGKNILSCPIVGVGAVGVGNVATSYEWIPNSEGGTELSFKHSIKSIKKLAPYNIMGSFTQALLTCLSNELENLETTSEELTNELYRLTKNFGVVQNLIDLLFNNSQKRRDKHNLKTTIQEHRKQIRELEPHKERLEQIALKEK